MDIVIKDKFMEDSFIGITKGNDTIVILIKKSFFTIKEEFSCPNHQYLELCENLYKISNREVDDFEWSSSNADLSIKGNYDYDHFDSQSRCLIEDNVIEFCIQISNIAYESTIYIYAESCFLNDYYRQAMLPMVRLEEIKLHDSIKKDEVIITLEFKGQILYGTCLNNIYVLQVKSKNFYVEKELYVLEEDRVDICEGLNMLIGSGEPYAIKLPDSMDAFWFIPFDDKCYLLDHGGVSDLEWLSNELIFRRLFVPEPVMRGLYNVIAKTK